MSPQPSAKALLTVPAAKLTRRATAAAIRASITSLARGLKARDGEGSEDAIVLRLPGGLPQTRSIAAPSAK
jgi:hypothetical protein